MWSECVWLSISELFTKGNINVMEASSRGWYRNYPVHEVILLFTGVCKDYCPHGRPIRHDSRVSHLQALDQVTMRPANFLGKSTEHTEPATRSHPDHLKRVWNNHTLLLVVRLRNSLEALLTQRINTSGVSNEKLTSVYHPRWRSSRFSTSL